MELFLVENVRDARQDDDFQRLNEIRTLSKQSSGQKAYAASLGDRCVIKETNKINFITKSEQRERVFFDWKLRFNDA